MFLNYFNSFVYFKGGEVLCLLGSGYRCINDTARVWTWLSRQTKQRHQFHRPWGFAQTEKRRCSTYVCPVPTWRPRSRNRSLAMGQWTYLPQRRIRWHGYHGRIWFYPQSTGIHLVDSLFWLITYIISYAVVLFRYVWVMSKTTTLPGQSTV